MTRSAGTESARADALRNRGAILDAAIDVLAVAPSASLAEVATRAGLGRATLYRHFESREALSAAIREEALARAGAALAGACREDLPVRDGLRQAAAALIPLGMRFRILLAEGADSEPEFLAAREQVLQPLSALISRGIAEGDIRSRANPAWVTMVLAGLLVNAVRAADAGVIGVDEAPDLVCDTLFEGLGHHD